MKIEQYKQKVIELFSNGKATEEQWKEMANAVSIVSERGRGEEVNTIDDLIGGPFVECCGGCGTCHRKHLGCDSCTV